VGFGLVVYMMYGMVFAYHFGVLGAFFCIAHWWVDTWEGDCKIGHEALWMESTYYI
jgi:hypothetical protein